MLDVFVKHGHNEVDNARVYCEGTSEEYLGKVSSKPVSLLFSISAVFLLLRYRSNRFEILQVDWKSRGIIIDTKLYPLPDFKGKPIKHNEECIREHIEAQLKNIKTDCLDMWYLRSSPFVDMSDFL